MGCRRARCREAGDERSDESQPLLFRSSPRRVRIYWRAWLADWSGAQP